jgi:hypothetical protein
MKSGSEAFIDYLILVLSLPIISNANTAAIAASLVQSRPDTQTVMIHHSFPTQTDLKTGCNNTLKHNYKTNNFMHDAEDTEMYSTCLLKRE